MTHSPISEVEAYWDALRGVRVMPLRSEIDPRGIERALDRTFLLERIAPGLARFRLAGARMNELMGMEVRGMPLTSFLTPPAREDARDAINRLFESPSTVRLSLMSEKSLGRPEIHGQMILLPLKSDLGDFSRAIGCFAFDGNIGRTPRRFDILSITCRDIGPFRTAQPKEPARDKAPGFAEPAPAFQPKKRDDAPFLRLVKSDKEE